MPLIKQKTITPASLAARRANAKLSTGPRTRKGKARIYGNNLKHGFYAKSFRDRLVRMGNAKALQTYDSILASIETHLKKKGPADLARAEKLARQKWCAWWQAWRSPVAVKQGGNPKRRAGVNLKASIGFGLGQGGWVKVFAPGPTPLLPARKVATTVKAMVTRTKAGGHVTRSEPGFPPSRE